ncbi:XRE family transcriptional regulator [Kiloniella litopenaei]
MRGQFRGISEAKMIQCLNRLGRDVDIVIKPRQHIRKPGRVEVVSV